MKIKIILYLVLSFSIIQAVNSSPVTANYELTSTDWNLVKTERVSTKVYIPVYDLVLIQSNSGLPSKQVASSKLTTTFTVKASLTLKISSSSETTFEAGLIKGATVKTDQEYSLNTNGELKKTMVNTIGPWQLSNWPGSPTSQMVAEGIFQGSAVVLEFDTVIEEWEHMTRGYDIGCFCWVPISSDAQNIKLFPQKDTLTFGLTGINGLAIDVDNYNHQSLYPWVVQSYYDIKAGRYSTNSMSESWGDQGNIQDYEATYSSISITMSTSSSASVGGGGLIPGLGSTKMEVKVEGKAEASLQNTVNKEVTYTFYKSWINTGFIYRVQWQRLVFGTRMVTGYLEYAPPTPGSC